jgi:hypothetical protein
MKAGQVLEAAKNGLFNVKISDDKQTGSLGDTELSLQQADKLIRNYGWIEYVLSPFEVMHKTDKFIRTMEKYIEDDKFWNTVDVTFQNRNGISYNRTFDRICLVSRTDTIAIIYNMENVSGKYLIYNMRNQSSPVAKCRNLKAVAEFLNGYDWL